MTNQELLIELCRPDTAERLAPALGALIVRLAEEEGTTPASAEEVAGIVTALVQSGSSDFLFASVDGAPAGCLQIAYRLSTWNATPYAYLEDFYLDPDVRGRGVGTKMLDYALQRAEGQKCDYVMLDVRTANRAAQRLYQRFGFEDAGSQIMKRYLPLGEEYCDTTTTLAAIEEVRRGSGDAS